MKWLCLLLTLLAPAAFGQSGRIYTAPDPSATGGLNGHVDAALTHAIAVEHDRVRVYLADLSDNGETFQFNHLPVGKYDLVLVTKDGGVFEGLALGSGTDSLSATSLANLETRVALADSFFNLHTIHRAGVDGTTLLAFVERISTRPVLKQSGEALNQNVRRLEVIELQQAEDDWQMTGTRHLYREAEPVVATPAFFKHAFVPKLGNIRVVDSVKDLGNLILPSQ